MRIAKGGSMFCYPEHIATEMVRVFGALPNATALRSLPAGRFAAEAAHFLAELNAVHPFRDGNGRTQLAFLALLAYHVGHPLDLDRLEPEAVLSAMIASFHGQEGRLVELIGNLLR